jgi:LEA14-like dessication related protein
MDRRLALSLLALLALTGCSKPKPPTLTPRSAQVTGVFPNGVELSVQLDAHNPNGFPLVVNQVTASFELQDGTPLGTAQSAAAFTIPSEGDQLLDSKLRVQLTSLAALAPYALTGKPVPYRLKGSAKIGSDNLNVDVPFTVEGVLTAEQVMAAGLRGAANFLQKP